MPFAPKVVHATAKVAHATPKVVHATPKVVHATPKVVNATPKVAPATQEEDWKTRPTTATIYPITKLYTMYTLRR